MIIAAAVCLAAGGAHAKMRHIHGEFAAPQGAPRVGAVGDVNGGWIVEATTSVGQCPGLIPTGLDIADGKLAGAAGFSGESWGYIDGDGQIVARFTSGGHIARLHGNLRGGHGAGAWSSSTDMCGGAWRATRGGVESAAQ